MGDKKQKHNGETKKRIFHVILTIVIAGLLYFVISRSSSTPRIAQLENNVDYVARYNEMNRPEGFVESENASARFLLKADSESDEAKGARNLNGKLFTQFIEQTLRQSC